jgi:LytS/YehU family sensor histidine kinase
MKDSVADDQFKAKLAVSDFEKRIELLDKEKQIHQQQLKQTAQQRTFLITGIAAILVLGTIFFRNIILKRKNEANLREIAESELQLHKLEYEKRKAELQKQTAELEMQALRAQMNPHFIFNSLNSINGFMLQNNKTQASDYLTKFSRLIRLILQNSQAALISLESELESLQLYLELESLRFNHRFAFTIKVQKDLDVSAIKVPPLIIQPFTENAIWHGLSHKEEKGELVIQLYEEDDMLYCKITDDGIGRTKAIELKRKSGSMHKSMGMRITADRIAIIQKSADQDDFISINDLTLPDGSAGGTEVLLKIPLLY